MQSLNQRSWLPDRMENILATLLHYYDSKQENLLSMIIVNSEPELTNYDNHFDPSNQPYLLTLILPQQIFAQVFDSKETFENRICDDINNIDRSECEYVKSLNLVCGQTCDPNWRINSNMHYSRAEKSPNVPDDAFKRIWGGSKIKLFLSHKAEEKENTSKLKDALQNVCGISSFVAHEDIHPTEEWQKEIENALFSMDALVALLTDGFKDSNWTDQEVGVAIGRGVPVIPVKISIIPYGFIGKYQALPGSGWDTPENMALKIFKTLYDCLPDNSLLFDCALEKYSNSPSYDDSSNRLRDLLSVFETLNENQITRVLEAYNSNDQNYKSRTGNDELIKLLYKWTGKRWLIINNELQPI